MTKVSKSMLKAKMFEYFRKLEQSGGELLVTDYGKPVLKIVPYSVKSEVAKIFHDVRGKIKLDRNAVLESTVDEWDL